jgi:hypothetical protein
MDARPKHPPATSAEFTPVQNCSVARWHQWAQIFTCPYEGQTKGRDTVQRNFKGNMGDRCRQIQPGGRCSGTGGRSATALPINGGGRNPARSARTVFVMGAVQS